MSRRRWFNQRSLPISPLVFGLLVQACSTETGPTEPLEPAPVTGVILGLVTADGTPVSGVMVTLSRNGSEVATIVTTENGEFGFTDLDAGTYAIGISEIEGADCSRQRIATVGAGEETEVAFACVTPAPAGTVGVGTVEGRVTVNGIGAAGVRVHMRGESGYLGATTTTNDGIYRFTDLSTGAKTVWIMYEDPCPGTQQENGRPQVEVTVLGEEVAIADFACLGQVVTGRVTVNGIAEPRLMVRLCHGLPTWEFGCVEPSQATDSDGRYMYTSFPATLSSFVPGEYVIFVVSPSTSCPERTGVPVSSGVAVTIDFHCVRPAGMGSVTLLPESLMVGVYETAQLTVIVRDMTGAVVTDPHVEFSVTGLWPATVDSTGLVTGLPGGCGVGTVIATSGGVTSNPVRLTIGSPAGEGCWDY